MRMKLSIIERLLTSLLYEIQMGVHCLMRLEIVLKF